MAGSSSSSNSRPVAQVQTADRWLAIVTALDRLSYRPLDNATNDQGGAFRGDMLPGPGDIVLFGGEHAIVMRVDEKSSTVTLAWADGSYFDTGLGETAYRDNIPFDEIRRLTWTDVVAYVDEHTHQFTPQMILDEFIARQEMNPKAPFNCQDEYDSENESQIKTQVFKGGF